MGAIWEHLAAVSATNPHAASRTAFTAEEITPRFPDGLTVLDAAGVKLARGEPLDGTSLRPLLEGKKLDRDALYFHYPHFAWHKGNRPGGAVRAGRYKLIRRYDDNSLELFDLATDPGENLLLWPVCSGAGNAKGRDDGCSTVFKYGMKRDFNAWLASLGAAAPVKTLTELREFNKAHSNRNAIKYGQANLDVSDEMDLEKDRARWQADREKDIRLAATHGIDEVMKAQKLDALLFPGGSGAGLAARPGYPSVIVPMALVPNAPTPPIAAEFEPKPQPYGVTFTGLACSEPRLIELAYAFEQATRRRVTPPGAP